jgi:hypothetical protein
LNFFHIGEQSLQALANDQRVIYEEYIHRFTFRTKLTKWLTGCPLSNVGKAYSDWAEKGITWIALFLS